MTALHEIAATFSLPTADGGTHSPTPGQVLVVVFTSNRCPFALAWHDRLLQVGRDYAPRGVELVMINSNAAEIQPQDSMESMRERYAHEDWGPVPYLRDEDQSIARAFDAHTTPDVFVLDAERRLRYRGAPDADCEEESEGAAWLRGALDAVLDGREVAAGNSFAVGCPIKWRATA
jgi:hypothetical protein